MKTSSIFLVAVFWSMCALAGVREALVSDKEMEVVHLKLGQSTILRFREKPKKAVIGNQNYFNVEFIDNDVSIQPLSTVTSNLFIYGEYHTFGIILKVLDKNDKENYDDLVIFKRKAMLPKMK